MLNYPHKLWGILLQSEDHGIGPCIKTVGHLKESTQIMKHFPVPYFYFFKSPHRFQIFITQNKKFRCIKLGKFVVREKNQTQFTVMKYKHEAYIM